jgi:Glycosidases
MDQSRLWFAIPRCGIRCTRL